MALLSLKNLFKVSVKLHLNGQTDTSEGKRTNTRGVSLIIYETAGSLEHTLNDAFLLIPNKIAQLLKL